MCLFSRIKILQISKTGKWCNQLIYSKTLKMLAVIENLKPQEINIGLFERKIGKNY